LSTFISFRSTRGGLQNDAGLSPRSLQITACLRDCDKVRCIMTTERGERPWPSLPPLVSASLFGCRSAWARRKAAAARGAGLSSRRWRVLLRAIGRQLGQLRRSTEAFMFGLPMAAVCMFVSNGDAGSRRDSTSCRTDNPTEIVPRTIPATWRACAPRTTPSSLPAASCPRFDATEGFAQSCSCADKCRRARLWPCC